MAAKKQSSGVIKTIIVLLLLLPLFPLTISLWNHDYKPQPKRKEFGQRISEADRDQRRHRPITAPDGPDGQSTPVHTGKLRLSVSLPKTSWTEIEARRDITLHVLMKNEGTGPVRILDAEPPLNLFDVRLFYLGTPNPEGEAPRPERVALKHDQAPAGDAAPPYAVTTLLAGRRMTIELPLAHRGDLSRPGRYSVEVAYQPMAYCTGHRIPVAPLRILPAPVVSKTIHFEVQARPTTPAKR